MAERMSTNLVEFTSPAFTPTVDSIFQFKSDGEQATVDVETRLNGSAPWIVVDTMHATSRKLIRVAQLPAVRFTLRNGKGNSYVWDSE
ncbi:hypothetical protein [Rhizobium sp. C1]|uniref:hypothetical protein n=1 Tax=Rhizobium sp. C1 TaxID=1349799 RepID=UPI001E53BBBB|nr:hypothetical protein [Rhizobium sp. C1]MCD2176431.1 hypothetical protein [Rhizobium sp. C1]